MENKTRIFRHLNMTIIYRHPILLKLDIKKEQVKYFFKNLGHINWNQYTCILSLREMDTLSGEVTLTKLFFLF